MTLPTEKPSYGVLDGVKVVFSAVEIAGPSAAEIMSEWGADVTWLENVWTGDSVRDTKWVKEMERRNMRSVSLNNFTDEGKEALFRIIKDADIFIEASKGGTWARKGITDEVLWEHNPKLVIVHISGFGQSGVEKRVKAAAYDLSVSSYAGLISQNGLPELPMNSNPYGADYFNALMVISASLAALHKANATGVGESIDLAMHETIMRIASYYMVDYLNDGTRYPRPGAGNPNLCAIGVYPANDGFLGLCCYGVSQNKYLLEAIGLGDLWGTEDYPEDTSALWKTSPKADLIEEKLSEYIASKSKYEVEDEFVAQRIAAQVVNEFPDLVDDEHLALRDTFIEWENSDGEPVKGLNSFPKFKRNPGGFWRPMPELGADTRDVLRKAGYSDEEINQLEADGVIKTAGEE